MTRRDVSISTLDGFSNHFGDVTRTSQLLSVFLPESANTNDCLVRDYDVAARDSSGREKSSQVLSGQTGSALLLRFEIGERLYDT